MSWPEVFASVGGGACLVALFWVLLREPTPAPPRRTRVSRPTLWKSSETTIRQPATGKNADGEPTWLGFTLHDIAERPDEYVALVRKTYPRPARKGPGVTVPRG